MSHAGTSSFLAKALRRDWGLRAVEGLAPVKARKPDPQDITISPYYLPFQAPDCTSKSVDLKTSQRLLTSALGSL